MADAPLRVLLTPAVKENGVTASSHYGKWCCSATTAWRPYMDYMNFSFVRTRQRLGFYECLPGPLLLDVNLQPGRCGIKIKDYAFMSFNFISTILSLPLKRVNSFCIYVCLATKKWLMCLCNALHVPFSIHSIPPLHFHMGLIVHDMYIFLCLQFWDFNGFINLRRFMITTRPEFGG